MKSHYKAALWHCQHLKSLGTSRASQLKMKTYSQKKFHGKFLMGAVQSSSSLLCAAQSSQVAEAPPPPLIVAVVYSAAAAIIVAAAAQANRQHPASNNEM